MNNLEKLENFLENVALAVAHIEKRLGHSGPDGPLITYKPVGIHSCLSCGRREKEAITIHSPLSKRGNANRKSLSNLTTVENTATLQPPPVPSQPPNTQPSTLV